MWFNIKEIADVITAWYQYKIDITDEEIINPASGGEVSFALDHIPIAKRSYTIEKNSIILTEGTDYTLTLVNGFLEPNENDGA